MGPAAAGPLGPAPLGSGADTRPSVFVIDPDAVARDAIVSLVRGAGLRARAFSSGQAFFNSTPTDVVACVVTEAQSVDDDMDVAQRVLDARGGAWAVVVVATRIDVEQAVDMMKAGVTDVIQKPFEPSRLLKSVRDNVERLYRERPRIEARERNARNLALLTSRERQVYEALTTGLSNKEIASRLEISPRTVEIFRAKVMAKMEAPSLPALVRISLGLP